METCENCHRQIGDLETPYVFNDHIVCKECHKMLSEAESPATQHPVPTSVALAGTPWDVPCSCGGVMQRFEKKTFWGKEFWVKCPQCGRTERDRTRRGRQIICPNPRCGYQGTVRREPRGSTGLGCLLTLLFFPIGILYFIFMSGYHYVCPRCGVKIRSDG